MWDNSTEDKNEGSIDHSRLKVPIKCQRWLPLTWITVNQTACRAYVCLFNKHWRANFAIYVYGNTVFMCTVRLKTTTLWLFVYVQTGDGYHKLIACIEISHTNKMLYTKQHVQYANVYTLLCIFVVFILNPNFQMYVMKDGTLKSQCPFRVVERK